MILTGSNIGAFEVFKWNAIKSKLKSKRCNIYQSQIS